MVGLTDLMMDTVGLVHYLEDSLPHSAAAAVERTEMRGESSFTLP